MYIVHSIIILRNKTDDFDNDNSSEKKTDDKKEKADKKKSAPKPKSLLFDSDSDDDLFKPKSNIKLGEKFSFSILLSRNDKTVINFDKKCI